MIVTLQNLKSEKICIETTSDPYTIAQLKDELRKRTNATCDYNFIFRGAILKNELNILEYFKDMEREATDANKLKMSIIYMTKTIKPVPIPVQPTVPIPVQPTVPIPVQPVVQPTVPIPVQPTVPIPVQPVVQAVQPTVQAVQPIVQELTATFVGRELLRMSAAIMLSNPQNIGNIMMTSPHIRAAIIHNPNAISGLLTNPNFMTDVQQYITNTVGQLTVPVGLSVMMEQFPIGAGLGHGQDAGAGVGAGVGAGFGAFQQMDDQDVEMGNDMDVDENEDNALIPHSIRGYYATLSQESKLHLVTLLELCNDNPLDVIQMYEACGRNLEQTMNALLP
jgi:hypothetical protein